MTVMNHFGRLGLGGLVKDHYATFYEIDANGRSHTSKDDVALFLVAPVVVALVPLAFQFRLASVGDVLAGLAILTGLLFGLLVHVFSVGLKIADDGKFGPTSDVARLARELMYNVAYSCGLGVALTGLLGAVAGIGVGKGGVQPVVSALVIALSVHLALTLLMVLKRVRVMYSKLGV
jgi:hypothetical protein